MFYKNRKIIYIVLLIIALLGSFFMGKKVSSMKKNAISDTKNTADKNIDVNTNYNQTVDVTGEGYSLNYSVSDALLLNKTKLIFNVNIQNNNNVKEVKVLAQNETNENIDIIPNVSDNQNSLKYTVNFDESVKTISIVVYPLTDQMTKNNKLDLSTLPYKKTKINIDSIKKQMIQDLSN